MSGATASPGKSFWSQLPLGPGVTLLTHDSSGLAALAKPAGILSHPSDTGGDRDRSLLSARYDFAGDECFEWEAEGGEVRKAKSEVRSPRQGDARAGEADPASPTAPSDLSALNLHRSTSPATAPAAASAATRRLWLLNRLDAGTSGVILVAASAELAAVVRAHFKQRHVQKVYQALVFGRPAQRQAIWRDRLAVQKEGSQIQTRAGGHIPAEAHMTLVRQAHHRSAFPLSLIQLEPQTGRSHQLRVQCAHRQLPIVGDGTYGDFRRNREFARASGEKRLFLHSLETSFDFEWRGQTRHFTARAPLPPEFEAALRG